MLFIGCGYSGTSLSVNLLRRYSVTIGHERSLICGMSNWMVTYEDDIVSAYKHTFMQVRHPMLVLNSALGTNWTDGKGWWMFKVNSPQPLTGLPTKGRTYKVDVRNVIQREYPHIQWDTLKYSFRILAWWVAYTEGALLRVQYWYRLEDLAKKAGCRQFIIKTILRIANINTKNTQGKDLNADVPKTNPHSKTSKTPQELWTMLTAEAESVSKKHILLYVEQLAASLGYDVTAYLHKPPLPSPQQRTPSSSSKEKSNKKG